MSTRVRAELHLPTDPQGAARILRERCYQYISLIQPLSHDALMWRGAESDGAIAIRSPSSDLLLDETYGAEGAKFFRDLEEFLRDHHSDASVLPSRAHIATGDKRVAMHWGTPASIWPVGQLRYAFWRDGSLVYKDGETLNQAKQRGGEMVYGCGLKNALKQGKEIMFEVPAFFELAEDLTSSVLEWLRRTEYFLS